MEKLTQSGYRKRNHARLEQESSSFKVAKNQAQVAETINLDRMGEDSSIIFSHFPEEIWLLITSKLEDPNSLGNLMQASLVFRNLLHARRAEFLFPQVWKVLGIEFENTENEVYDYDVDEMYPETPWCSRILTLRLVCKCWCRGVDKFYQNLPDTENYTSVHYSMDGDKVIDVVERDPENEDYFPSGNHMGQWSRDPSFFDPGETHIEDFMRHFDPTHFDSGNQKNPIFSRYVSINIEDSNRQNAVLPLLSKYGHHVWYCQLCLEENFPTRITFYTKITEILELLPNLKKLRLVDGVDDRIFDHPRLFDSISETVMKRKIASNPLPTLRDLECLSVENIPSCIFNPLVSVNSHITTLEVTGDDVHEGYDIYTFPMPNLKQLSMKYFSKTEFENLSKPEVNWPLQKIYLDFRHCHLLPWSEIFSLLEKNWSETLKDVIIDTSNPDEDYRPINIIEDGSTTTLNLPNVQRLKFITKEFCSLDFILPLKSLEFLEIGLYREDEFIKTIVTALRLIEKNQVVQFVGYFKRFHQSNIWKLFPNLKTFKLGVADFHDPEFDTTYTRKESENVLDEELKPSTNNNLWYMA